MNDEKPKTMSGMSINLNPRNMAMAALLFLGGAGGGGIGSNLIGGDVKAEISELKETVQDVKADLVEIKADLKADRRGEEQILQTLSDHEDRLRELERAQ